MRSFTINIQERGAETELIVREGDTVQSVLDVRGKSRNKALLNGSPVDGGEVLSAGDTVEITTEKQDGGHGVR